jgi:hypothetical protein
MEVDKYRTVVNNILEHSKMWNFVFEENPELKIYGFNMVVGNRTFSPWSIYLYSSEGGLGIACQSEKERIEGVKGVVDKISTSEVDINELVNSYGTSMRERLGNWYSRLELDGLEKFVLGELKD